MLSPIIYRARARDGYSLQDWRKKRGPDRAISGSSGHLISPFTLKGANMPPFWPLFCPLPAPHYRGDVEDMHMVCISPRIPPLRGLAVALRPFRLFYP